MPDSISIDFLIPPAVLILLAALSAWATLWRPHVGVAFAIITTSLLYLAALPVIAARMIEEVEIKTPAKPDFSAAQAIVVLGGGVHPGDGDKVPDTLGPWSLERIVLAAQAYKQLNLKVAVSGGRVAGAHVSEASLMKAALETQFGVPVTWVDDQSRTTYRKRGLHRQAAQSRQGNDDRAGHPGLAYAPRRCGLSSAPGCMRFPIRRR